MNRRISTILIAGIVVPFAGCSSATPSVPSFSRTAAQTTAAQSNDDVDAKKKKLFETLKLKGVVVKVQSCTTGSGEATFTAKGKAKGRYRGKVTVTGAWNFVNISGVSFWTFGETFKIKGRHPITGTIEGSASDAIATCKTFGPVTNSKDLQYHLGTKTGAPTMNVIKNGTPLLQKLR